MYHPDELLTSAPSKRDVDTSPHIIALDPFPSDDCLDDFSPTHLFPLTRTEELNTMNTSDDEPSSGLNGRLRPRKSAVPSPQTTKPSRKSDGKPAQEKPKRTSTPSKVLNKPDDLANKSDSSLTPHFLCPYCDKKFAAKQAISKHVRRMHSFTSKQDSSIGCLFCNHAEAEPNDIIRHMVDSHPNQYFACLNCHTRFPSTTELAEHKLNICEKQKVSYRTKLRQKTGKTKKSLKTIKIDDMMKEFQDAKSFPTGSFNGIVISCELKPTQVHDEADIEDNITTNLILPPSKALGSNSVLDKNAVILLDDIQWNKRIPSNFSFHNTDADQILSRLGVVHRSPRTGESTKRDWLRTLDDATQKFEKCFDTSFYTKVASNVQENLTKFLDGSFNFNPDPDSTIKTRKWKNSVVINTAEGFPILLACEQYSRNTFDGYMPRAIAPKHKWKWDNLESDRTAVSADQIKRDSHTNNCIITLVSSLDIWTQSCMRRKYEEKYNYSPLSKKTDKQTAIEKELKEILESREIPSTSSQVVKYKYKPPSQNEDLGFPASLGLAPSTPKYELPPAVLSGEWVRPRCFVCCACGAPTSDSRALSAHMAHRHPNAQVQHYEVVGELLLNADILKHLYVPPNQMHNRTRPLRGFRECTKCRKSITLEDLHQHMLDCAGDTPAVRRKCRYRPFGVRRRRPRLPDNRIRKKIRKDLRNRQSNEKAHMRARPRNRTEVGDAETIRKMLADLPAKRHRVLVNPGNSVLRPRNKLDKQRTKLLMKRRLSEDPKNRRLRALKSTNYSEQVGSSANEDQNKNSFVKNDDDKPLKRTVKRVTTKCTRQTEAIKRKVALNRAKRKLKSAEKALADNENGPVRNVPSTSGAEPDQLSIENTPQRIDVNNGSYNTRENSSRGSNGSNNGPPNNGDQPPGNQGHNGEPNRSRAPMQNTPLKHSIARLTADCETHDKSVQFHHSFLVQQECNNLNQHVPTGHQLLFENEAAITRLDKPPLASSGHRGILDQYSLQKSKLNKPRKGLNDCIAMLKNKLVEPTPGLSTSQISVQCGGDDPLDAEPPGAPSAIEDKHVDTSKPAEIFSRHNMNLEMERPYESNYEYPCENKFTSERPSMSLPYEIIPPMPSLPPGDTNLKPQLETPPKQKTSAATKRQSSRRRSARAGIESIPPFVPEVKQIEPVPTKRHSDRVSQRRTATQRIVVNINTEINKNEMLDMASHDKLSPRQISPKQVIINTEVCRDEYTDGRSSRKLSAEQVSPKYVSVNEIHKSRSRSESLSKQVSPGQAYEAFVSNKSAHRLISPQPGIHDIDIHTATKLSPKQVSPKQVSPKQVALLSPKQISVDTSRSTSNQSSPNQISPKPVSQAHHDMYSKFLQNQATAKYYDGQSSSKMPSPSQVPPRQVSQSHDLNRLTPKAGFPVQTSSMPAPKQVSPKQMTQAFDILPYSKSSSSSSMPSPRQVAHSLDIQTSSKLSPREMSPRHVSPRLVSPRQSLDINTEMTFIRSKETPSPRYANISTEPLQSEDLRAQVPLRVSSHGGHSHPRASSQSRSASRTSKLRSPSQPRELASHPQGPPVILLYAPPPPPPPPPPPAASISPQVLSHLQLDSQAQPQWQTTAYHDMVRQNPPDTNEHNRTRKLSVDVYSETEFSRIPSNIPPAHASTIIEPLVSVPLDLSGKPPNESDSISKNETSSARHYENYETLDLSNKNSSFTKRDVTDVVVDLRVKPASQGSSLTPLEQYPNTSQNEDVITDLTILGRHDELIPKDLSFKTKHTDGVHTTSSNEQRYGIQGFSNQKLIQPVEVHVEEGISIVEAPTDLSGKMTTSSSHGGVQSSTNQPVSVLPAEQISYISHATSSTTLPNIHNAANPVADLVETNSINTKPNFSSDVHKVTPQTSQDNIHISEAYDNANSMQQSVYGSALTVPSFKKRAAISNTVNTKEDTHTQAGERSKESAAIVSTLPIYTLPSLVSSSHISRHESTKPVYTLAKACISVTKINGPGVIPITTSLSSIPSTTIASSMPVYTLASTTIASSVNYGSNSTLGSQMSPPFVSMPSSIQVGCEDASEIERQVNSANKSLIGNQKLKDEACNVAVTNTEQDPETARKIAMLPKELVEILGTMPPGHRNQLLNVLPQYVSQTNTQVEGIRTTGTLTGISMSQAISRQTTFSENAIAKYENTINYQNAMVKIPSDSRYSVSNLSISQANDNFESDVKEHFPLNSLPSLLCAVNKSSLEDIKPPIRTSNSLSESKVEIINLDISEKHVAKLDNPTVIDLTEDENASSNTVLKTTDGLPPSVVVSSHAAKPIINLSTVTKPKGTNEKTSMLRAVRIKTPSERHKSVSTEIHLSKGILEKDTSVTNHDSENPFNKTLAIQQSEVSSTQQQQKKDAVKFTSQISPIPTEISTEVVEPDKIQRSISTEQNISLDEIEDKSVAAKTVLVTSSISTSDLLSKETAGKEILHKIVTEDEQRELPSCADQDITLKTSSNEMPNKMTLSDNLIESSTSLIKVSDADEIKKINLTDKNEEDSDDDISLAVIVKQKQLDRQSAKKGKNKLEQKKKRKEKHIKKIEKKLIEAQLLVGAVPVASTASTNPIDSASVISQDNKIEELNNKETTRNQPFTTSVLSLDDKKHSKKKNKKSRRGKNLSMTTNISGTDLQKQDSLDVNLGLNSVSSSSSKPQDEKVVDDSKLNKEGEEVQKETPGITAEISETLQLSLDNHNANQKISCNIMENDEDKIQYSNKKEKMSKKATSKLTQSNTNTPNVHEKEGHIILQDSEKICLEKQQDDDSKVIEPDSCSLLELSDTQDSIVQESFNNTEESNSEIVIETKNNKRNIRTKKSKNIEINDYLEIPKIHDHSVTPLRRSRRGKSLFLDGKTSELESTSTEAEILIEQKTPLTKKQLIFSKLLLDEENNVPQAHSTPVKYLEKTEDDSPIIKPSSIDITSSFNETEISKNMSEKNKPNKRRQSPQLKRKVKKPKSVENTQQTGEDTNTDNLEQVKNRIVKIDVIPQVGKCAIETEANDLNIRKKQDVDISDQYDINKSIEESKNRDNSESAIGKDNDHRNKLPSSAEKRKNSESFEIDQSTKSKKCKFNTKETVNTVDIPKDISTTIDKTSNKNINSTSINPEVRTTCYNKPMAAARRTRSKSAVVKSSGTMLYDPYDIDLDEMNERNEPIFIKKGRTSDAQATSSSYLVNSKPTPKTPKKSTVVLDKTTSVKQRKAATVREQVITLNKDTDNAMFHEDLMEDVRGSISDSDDSSKSDVPLQKYVVEKEKRMSDMDHVPLPNKDVDDDIDFGELSGDKNNSNDSKSSRKTLADCNNVDGAAPQSETEEQLRSEQFMESFGFFSERKPRKSNLLASKKISETFHIIANESDDVYFGYKDRVTKKSQNENNKKSADSETNSSKTNANKKATKRGRKKKGYVKPVPCFCFICKREYKRPDNYLRHQMSLVHVSKLSEVELKIKTPPVHEEPNYLIAYKQYLDRLKVLTDKLAKKRKHKGSTKIKLPTVDEILADLNKNMREQRLCHRGELSRDEALFLDCCELLKESHKKEKPNVDTLVIFANACLTHSGNDSHINQKQLLDDTKSDGDVDSITAKTILESEEVRNLENDLISGLKEAANASLNSKMDYKHVIDQSLEQIESFNSSNVTEYEKVEELEVVEKPHVPEKSKRDQREVLIEEKDFVYKEKMYPDIIEDIDMFEDKFDKIKRKCRSQAAAAKQSQIVAEPNESHKARRKSEKKKGKKTKKSHQNSHVPTKGALKGFDGIKVSIPTSEINMSAIVPSVDQPTKKKKKSTSKKKRDKKDSESSCRYDSDQRGKEVTSQKKVDVYEFMDNEEAELFEFRPSTLMERFKNILNKETPSTSKSNPADDVEDSSESASDGDDFVYMSDDYVCSDDETENSLLSCEMGTNKVTNEPKKTTSPLKRKDVVEKNAVMGKIFKHNAVRTEKKTSKSKEPAKSKANLDQLFDSLLEDEPSTSTLKSDSPRKEEIESLKEYSKLPASTYEPSSSTYEAPRASPAKEFAFPRKIGSSFKYESFPSTSKKPQRPSLQAEEFIFSTKKYDSEDEDYGPSTSKRFGNCSTEVDYGPSTSKMYDMRSPEHRKVLSPTLKRYDDVGTSKGKDYISSKYVSSSMRNEEASYKRRYSSDKSPTRKTDEGISTSYDYGADVFEQSYDDTGVARHRARRKCTVGKQNVLAETWSSESEPERGPPRPTSAESVLSTGGRKKKGKKKESQQFGGRRGNRPFRKQDESRVSSSRRTSSSHDGGSSYVEEYGASTSVSTGVQVSLGPPHAGPSNVKPRSVRAPPSWGSEDEQEHLQQHGWIVGDSHKKLVTMLAHAKGRKRNSDDKRHLVE